MPPASVHTASFEASQRVIALKLVTVAAFLGLAILIGLSLATFQYAQGLSYLSSDSAACANCHIMQPQYDAWLKSSHKSFAGCIDCHLPHALVPKYLAKAENGWNHSRAFTLGDFHEPILINAKNSAILQANCIECHGTHSEGLLLSNSGEAPLCVHCHASVGHGERAGLGGPPPQSSLIH